VERNSVRKQVGLGLAAGLLQHAMARWFPRLYARLVANERRSRQRAVWRTVVRTIAVRMAFEAWLNTGDRAAVRAEREGWRPELAPETVFLYLVTPKELQGLHEKALRRRPRREWMPLLDARRRDLFTDADGDFWALDSYLSERRGLTPPEEFHLLVDDLDEHLGGDWRVLPTDANAADLLRRDSFDLDDWRDFYRLEEFGDPPDAAVVFETLDRLGEAVAAAGPDQILLIRGSEF
jgi:hypothetical protein